MPWFCIPFFRIGTIYLISTDSKTWRLNFAFDSNTFNKSFTVAARDL